MINSKVLAPNNIKVQVPSQKLSFQKGHENPYAHVVNETPLDSFEHFAEQHLTNSVNLVNSAFNAKGDDYALGRMNDTSIRMGSLGIATMAAANLDKVKGVDEFLGFACWFAAMGLTPKIINKMVQVKFGLDLDKEYVDSYGRRKQFFEDPGYLPWHLFPEKELYDIGDKMEIPRDVRNRKEAIQNRIKEIVIQSKTWMLLSAGVSTPVMASLIADKLKAPSNRIRDFFFNKNFSSSAERVLKLSKSKETIPKSIEAATDLIDKTFGENSGSAYARLWADTNDKFVDVTGLDKHLKGKYSKIVPKSFGQNSEMNSMRFADEIDEFFKDRPQNAQAGKNVLNNAAKTVSEWRERILNSIQHIDQTKREELTKIVDQKVSQYSSVKDFSDSGKSINGIFEKGVAYLGSSEEFQSYADKFARPGKKVKKFNTDELNNLMNFVNKVVLDDVRPDIKKAKNFTEIKQLLRKKRISINNFDKDKLQKNIFSSFDEVQDFLMNDSSVLARKVNHLFNFTDHLENFEKHLNECNQDGMKDSLIKLRDALKYSGNNTLASKIGGLIDNVESKFDIKEFKPFTDRLKLDKKTLEELLNIDGLDEDVFETIKSLKTRVDFVLENPVKPDIESALPILYEDIAKIFNKRGTLLFEDISKVNMQLLADSVDNVKAPMLKSKFNAIVPKIKFHKIFEEGFNDKFINSKPSNPSEVMLQYIDDVARSVGLNAEKFVEALKDQAKSNDINAVKSIVDDFVNLDEIMTEINKHPKDFESAFEKTYKGLKLGAVKNSLGDHSKVLEEIKKLVPIDMKNSLRFSGQHNNLTNFKSFLDEVGKNIKEHASHSRWFKSIAGIGVGLLAASVLYVTFFVGETNLYNPDIKEGS